jgi:hypothetical protein
VSGRARAAAPLIPYPKPVFLILEHLIPCPCCPYPVWASALCSATIEE